MKKPDFQTRASKKREAFKENIFRHSITWGFILSLMYLARILIELKNPMAYGSDDFDIATFKRWNSHVYLFHSSNHYQL